MRVCHVCTWAQKEGGGKHTSFTYNAERVLGSGSFGIVYQAMLLASSLETPLVLPPHALLPKCFQGAMKRLEAQLGGRFGSFLFFLFVEGEWVCPRRGGEGVDFY